MVGVDEYGVVLRPRLSFNSVIGRKDYEVAAITGLEYADLGYGNMVQDEKFEHLVKSIQEFTDIESYLSRRNVYVDEVNAENSGNETTKYRKKTEDNSEENSNKIQEII
jgi:hypothetical protein